MIYCTGFLTFFVDADLLTGILSHKLYKLASKWRVRLTLIYNGHK